MVGQFEGHRFHPRFKRIGGTACEVDAAGIQLHDEQKIQRRQPTLCPDFYGREIDRSHHVPMRLEECFPGSRATQCQCWFSAGSIPCDLRMLPMVESLMW